MPNTAPSEDSESRTASVGRRLTTVTTSTAPSTSTSSLHSSTSSPRSTSGKKRKRGKKVSSNVRDFVPMGGNFSKSSELMQPTTTSSPTNPANTSTSTSNLPTNDDIQVNNTTSSAPSLGNNRLATGFKAHPTPQKTRSHSNSSLATSPDGSRDDAIEISSDEEGEDSEGGMIVNLNDNIPELTNDSASEDEGMVTSSDDGVGLQIQQDLTRMADHDDSTESETSNMRLLDLSPEELEDQLQYAFYHLDRTQVDLNRLVICLACMQTGHLSSGCPENNCKHCAEDSDHPTNMCPNNRRCSKCRERGHTSQNCSADLKVTTVPCDVCGRLSHVEQECLERHFLQPSIEGPVKLWISCCICASKSHLVGDCPDAPANAATARWSLKSFEPGQITNLSLESGTRRLEKDAETRGMRPPGLQIRGRASHHRAGVSRSAPVSDDERGFLRPPVGRSQPPLKPQVRFGGYEHRQANPPLRAQSDRYDHFDAPSFDSRSRNRGRGDWYETDSFGRRRSRSPRPDTWRPSSRRTPSPRRFDSYSQPDRGYRGLPPSDYWRPPPSSLPPRPPPSKNNSGTGMLAPSRPVQLPTRKGSNPNLPSTPPTSIPAKSPIQAGPAASTPRKAQNTNTGGGKKNKKKGSGGGSA